MKIFFSIPMTPFALRKEGGRGWVDGSLNNLCRSPARDILPKFCSVWLRSLVVKDIFFLKTNH